MVSEYLAESNVDSSLVTLPRVAADADVNGQFHTDIDRCLETIIDWVNQDFGMDALIEAKEEFFWKTGKVFYDDEFFNQRMSYFTDFFLFQRPLAVANPALAGMTPLQAYCELFVMDQAWPLKDVRHSLFYVQKVKEQEMQIIDLLCDDKYTITKRENETFRGVAKKQVFQGFVYVSGSRNLLSRGLVFHPKEAVSGIKKFLKKVRKERGFDEMNFLARLARQQLRQLRHRHVDPKLIYSEDPSV